MSFHPSFLLVLLSLFSLFLIPSPILSQVETDPDTPSKSLPFFHPLTSAPPSFCLVASTSVPDSPPIIFNISREWSPNGFDHFVQLLAAGFYSDTPLAFFRVVPSFVVQFGISGLPSLNTKYGNVSINDDPVLISNVIGTLTYADAGVNTRTTQLFVNTQNNPSLDASGFTPFGVAYYGFDTFNNIYNPTPGNSNGIDQGNYSQYGNPWILQNYPQVQFLNYFLFAQHTSCPVTTTPASEVKKNRVIKKVGLDTK